MDFAYKTRDSLGGLHEGILTSASREEAAQSLRREGMHVMSLEESDDSLGLFPRRITKSEIIYMTNQLAIMVDTGISLAVALAGLAEQEDNLTLKLLLNDLRSEVEAGEDFSTALAKHPKYFDQTFVSLIKSSEQTGSMGEMLDHISNYLRKELDGRRKVRSALAYPIIMLVMATGVTIFLLTFIMPKFTPLFTRKGIKLPTITKFMMVASDLLLDYWVLWLILAVILIVGGLVGRRTEVGRRIIDWMRINIPVVGPTFRKVIISRSIRTLGTMITNGVAVLDAIQLTAEVSGNYYYEKAWLHVRAEVTNGSRIADALRTSSLFPKTLVQMIGSGEETGKLDYVLVKVSTYYDGEVDTSLKTATSMIEPLLISAMGVVVGTIGLSLLLPIFTLSRTH
ncbi:MAG TPA: type II secretion system F family protein [Pirellulaceae bacterium]|nr:type II secretion system F family protein [Pirellulaceae bacterium]